MSKPKKMPSTFFGGVISDWVEPGSRVDYLNFRSWMIARSSVEDMLEEIQYEREMEAKGFRPSDLQALICDYCGQRNEQERIRCYHCGAPLRLNQEPVAIVRLE